MDVPLPRMANVRQKFSGTRLPDISGYQLVGNAFSFTFPPNIKLTPASFLCVARDPAQFRSAYGNAVQLAGDEPGRQ